MPLRRRDRALVASGAEALTAAGSVIDLTDEAGARKQRRRPLDWQKEAWRFYDEIGEIRQPARYQADGLAKLRIYPAYRADPEQPPVSVLDESADANAKRAAPALMRATERLYGPDGTPADVLRSAGLNVFVAGEGNLVGAVIPEIDPTRETWGVYSVEEFVADPAKTGSKYALKPAPDAKLDEYITVPPAAFALRLWRRHPHWSDWPDSAMRGALEVCEELQVLTQMVLATAMSRLSAGMIGVPKEMSFGDKTNPTGDEQKKPGDSLTNALIEHFGTAIKDPKSASRWVPFILRAQGDDLAKMWKWDFTRPIDELAIRLREEARERLAVMLDMPAEILTGKADINHWGSWQIKEEADREVLSLAELILPAISRGYLQPTVAKMNVDDASRYFFWYDAQALVSHPNEAERYTEAYDRAEVGGEAYRRANNIPEDDAPDDAERERIIATKVRLRGGVTTNGVAPSSNGASPETQKPGVPVTAPPTVETPGNEAAVAAAVTPAPPLPSFADLAMIAAGTPGTSRLGRTLADMERGLRARIQAAADASLRRGLERAGNRLRSMARRANPGAWRAVVDVDPMLVAETLGPAVVSALADDDSSSPDALLAGTFEQLRPRYELWVSRAQREAADLVRTHGPAEADDAEWERLDREMTENRAGGWTVLEAGLTAAAAERLFAPNRDAPGRGEFDATSLVDPHTVRESLIAAGGGPTDEALGAGGALKGVLMARAIDLAGLERGRMVWIYGDPGSRSQPFEPHEALDGTEFASWDDPALVNDEGFPESDHYEPDDHDGCLCDVMDVIAEKAQHMEPTTIAASAANRSE